MDDLMFRLNQTKVKKTVAKKVKADHDKQWNYKAKTFNGHESFRLEQTKFKKDVAKKVKADHDEQWNYKSKALCGLESYRFAQTKREADWKKKGVDQVRKGPLSAPVPLSCWLLFE